MTDNSVPAMVGLRGVKLPVRDVEASASWYARVFGWVRAFEFPDEDGVVRGVAGPLPGTNDTGLALRQNPQAVAQEGLELSFVVETRDDLDRWVEHLDGLSVRHSPVIDATVSWLVVLKDPDGHELHLFTREQHALDQSGRPGYGRVLPAGEALR